jgi:MFS family permease
MYPGSVVDWGGKVAAWFAAVATVSAALAALIAGTAKQPLHGGLHILFIILVIIAAVSFAMLLLTGPRAVWAWWRNRRRARTARSASPDAEPSILPVLRDLRTQGLSLQARLADRGFIVRPPGLPDHIKDWERAVSAALESRPALREQFEAPPGTQLLIIFPNDDLRRRLETRMGVLEAIIHGLAEAGGQD